MVRQNEGVLESIYRSLVDDSARQAQVREIVSQRQEEMESALRDLEIKHVLRQSEIESKILECQTELSGLHDAAAIDLTRYVDTALAPCPTKLKEERLLRAHQLGLVVSDRKLLERPGDSEYDLLKRSVREDDHYKCVCCDKGGTGIELHVHHIIPLSKFGTNQKQNLVTLCHTCHNKQHPGFQVTRNQPIHRSPRKQRFIAVDLETTGFSNDDSIIEIGAALFVAGQLNDVFTSLVYTKRQLPPAITRLTGITPEHIQSAPRADVAFEAFRQFIGNSRLVFHNSAFDMRFLNRYAEFFKTPLLNAVHDTLTISRMKLPDVPNHKLHTLVEHLQLNVNPSHRAKDDAIATGALYIHLSGIKSPRSGRKKRSST